MDRSVSGTPVDLGPGNSWFERAGRDGLLEALVDAAKLWLAHDGLWFQAVERHRGLDEAIALDIEAMREFARLEAQRTAQRLGLGLGLGIGPGLTPGGGGLETLARALDARLYALINAQQLTWERPARTALVLKVVTCRVQAARRRKGLPDFACKPVGLAEYSAFSAAIDPRIVTECVACPPDPGDPRERGYWCAWRFRIG